MVVCARGVVAAIDAALDRVLPKTTSSAPSGAGVETCNSCCIGWQNIYLG